MNFQAFMVVQVLHFRERWSEVLQQQSEPNITGVNDFDLKR